ncbi:hypothetical protein FZC78_10575 [Rossellomorea vietnamensis]|uniref:Uncharacterized protein n=1 Tax=Rossellomorea vietnamensis TaxID=218284 RepID=A0A5D4NWF1_9BACI|nr:hypothetical protein [Rossellomorea vietnamensis]TYS17062.1 hypothetical protein FZC78_10575 [Rossellomorea vietnamensis]
MAKLPIKPIIKLAKTHGPAAAKFVKKHGPAISQGAAFVGSAGKIAKDFRKNRKESEQYLEKNHPRKIRFHQYKTKIVPVLHNMNRLELFKGKLEVEDFIAQIKEEEQKEASVKKPLHTKRLKDWNDILIQMEAKIAARDYQEYIMIYNNPSYHSEYFTGYERQLEKFRNLVENQDNEELYGYLLTHTKRSKEEIKVDFSL